MSFIKHCPLYVVSYLEDTQCSYGDYFVYHEFEEVEDALEYMNKLEPHHQRTAKLYGQMKTKFVTKKMFELA
jgi:hypothetical protein